MIGIFNTSHWAPDLDNAANKKFVAEFEKEYDRLPTLYASQGYDAALLIDAAVRDVKRQDRGQGRAAQGAEGGEVRRRCAASSSSTRNQYPIQNYYLREVGKDGAGRPRSTSPFSDSDPSRTTATPTCKTACWSRMSGALQHDALTAARAPCPP